MRERDLGSFAKPSSEPLGAYLDRWLETAAKPKLKARTYRDYETLLMRYVRPSLEARPLAKVTPLDVQAVYGKILEKGLSAHTVRYTMRAPRSPWMCTPTCCPTCRLPPPRRWESCCWADSGRNSPGRQIWHTIGTLAHCKHESKPLQTIDFSGE